MLALIAEEKTKAAFARKVGTDPAYISQILSIKTKADIGNELARAIEAAYTLPYGWMDHEQQAAKDGNSQNVITDFERTYNNANDEGKKFLIGAIDAAQAFIEDQKGRRKEA